MKRQFFRNCAYLSTVLFLGFVGLYAYVWIDDPNPKVSGAGIHWSYISIGHTTKSLTGTNGPTTGTYIYDDSGLRFTATKEYGGNLVFFNQAVPFFGGTIGFAGDKTVSEKGWDGCGIYFRIVKDTKRADSWWTFMISLWYPVIIFGILPIVFVVKRLCSVKSPVQSEVAKT
jgi:hypothetical protein